jgi:hypothetical protein
MSETARLLDALKQKFNLPSDNQLATRLGLTRQRIHGYRCGDTLFSEERCIEIALLLECDPGPVLIAIHAERLRKTGRYAAAKAFDAIASRIRDKAPDAPIGFSDALPPARKIPLKIYAEDRV